MPAWMRSRRERLEPWRDWAIIALLNNIMLTAIAVLHPRMAWLFLLAVPLGVGLTIGTLTVLHDAGHSMYSRRRAWLNVLAVHSSTPVGLWVGHWGLKHRVHHKLSQVYPVDEATRSSGLVRLHPAAPRQRVHSSQHWHAWPLYCLAWAGELRSQLTYLRSGVVTGTTDTSRGSRWRSFACEKALWLVALTPYAVILGVLPLALLLLIAMSLASLLAATALAVGHINVGLEPDESGRSDWANNLLLTTASFAPDSRVLRWMTGGLTNHLGHHFKPVAVRSELPRIEQTVVRAAAERVGITPVVFGSLHAAVIGHGRRLRELGRSSETIAPTPPSAAEITVERPVARQAVRSTDREPLPSATP